MTPGKLYNIVKEEYADTKLMDYGMMITHNGITLILYKYFKKPHTYMVCQNQKRTEVDYNNILPFIHRTLKR